MEINQLVERNLVLPPFIRFKCSLLNLIERCTANAALVYRLHYPEMGQWHPRAMTFDGASSAARIAMWGWWRRRTDQTGCNSGDVPSAPRHQVQGHQKLTWEHLAECRRLWCLFGKTPSEIIQLEADGSTQMRWLQEDLFLPIISFAPNPGTFFLESFIGTFVWHQILIDFPIHGQFFGAKSLQVFVGAVILHDFGWNHLSFMGSFWHQILTDFCWSHWLTFFALNPHRFLLEPLISNFLH